MHDQSDTDLARDYAEANSQESFAERVRRHVNQIYSASLRPVGVPVQAQEITQSVFIVLARKAGTVQRDTVVAWLSETTRLTSIHFLRTEQRRAMRGQESFMQSELHEPSSDSSWERMAPLLDGGRPGLV